MTPIHAPPDRPLILICNDDGIAADGIHALAESLDGLGTLAVVAPLHEQSAVGHSITIRDPMRTVPTDFELASGPVWAHAVTGTPADCIKIAVQKMLPRVPDLVVSGINHGPNTAVNVLYSGTVSAATEAAILGIPSIAMSHCEWSPTDWAGAQQVARSVAERTLSEGLPAGHLLNVNVPGGPASALRGIRITRQARSRWEEQFEERHDPGGRPYFWLGGRFVDLDDGDNTDTGAITDGFVSVTPLHADMTAHGAIDHFASWTDALAASPDSNG